MLIEGYASTILPDARGRSIAPSAFGETLYNVQFCIDHDQSRRAGVITELAVKERGLFCTAELDPRLHGVSLIASEIASGIRHGFSINAKRIEGWWTISRADLFEVSICRWPVNPECVVSIVRPPVKLWPDQLAEVFADMDAAAAQHKSQNERRIKTLLEKVR